MARSSTRYKILAYGPFFHVPRGIDAKWRDLILVLDAPFDEAIDDYQDRYQVQLVLGLSAREYRKGAFDHRDHQTVYVGTVHLSEMTFDQTRRKWFMSKVLDDLLAGHQGRN